MTARTVTDYRVLAALAHPLRRRLLDVLRVDGPSTASMLAERTGQAVGNISHHVRVLASHGLVEEAPELAKDRRERWWRAVSMSLRWSTTDFDEEPAAEAAAQAASFLGLDRQVGLVRSWLETETGDTAEWRDASFNSDAWLHLSAGELAAMSREINDLVQQWRDRTEGTAAATDPAGAERRPVFFLARGFPARP
jgi:DNA-binding transcriptional ArsR family regulator